MRTSSPIILSKLIGAREPLFSLALKKAELATRHSAVDVRLIADIYERANSILRKLGLKYDDLKPEEVYYSLTGNSDEVKLFATQTEFVGLILDGEIVSFNYEDVLANQGKMFSERTHEGLRKALAHELVQRYRDHDTTHTASINEIFRHGGFDWEIKQEKSKKERG